MSSLKNNLPKWTSFDIANPKTAIKILIKLADGRELKGCRIHTELLFDDTMKDNWELQQQATHWKYIK